MAAVRHRPAARWRSVASLTNACAADSGLGEAAGVGSNAFQERQRVHDGSPYPG